MGALLISAISILYITLMPLKAIAADCVTDGQSGVFVGKVSRETFPGRPNYESIANGDEPETVWILTLDQPRCVMGVSPEDGRPYEIGKVSNFQLMLSPDQYNMNRSLLEHRAQVKGQLFQAMSGHHHAKALIQVKAIEGIQDFRYSSTKYLYSISLPSGWIQIPDTELARLKEHLPPQAQHLIYDAAFQRGNAGKWFELPYVIVQVISSDRTRIHRLPNEAELQQVSAGLSGRKVILKVKEAIDAVPSQDEKDILNSLLPSLTTTFVQVDMSNYKYRFVVDGNDSGPMKIYIEGTFMPDGNVIQLNAYTSADGFKQDLGQFLLIAHSLRKTLNP